MKVFSQTPVEGLRGGITKNSFLLDKVQDLSGKLDKTISLQKAGEKRNTASSLCSPNYPDLNWIVYGLVLVCSGWYMTAGKLDSYIASDTNYRQLRLDTSHKSLQHYLDRVDSLYNIRPNMRKMLLKPRRRITRIWNA